MWSTRGKHGPGIGLRMLGISSETRMLPFLYHILFPWHIPQLLPTLRYTLFPCTECCFAAPCLWTGWFLWLEHPSLLYLTILKSLPKKPLLVSYCCGNKLLKITQIYYLTVLELRSSKKTSLLLGSICFIAFSRFLAPPKFLVSWALSAP